MDILAVKQACKFAKEHALKNGPIVSLIYCIFHMIYLLLLNWFLIVDNNYHLFVQQLWLLIVTDSRGV